MSFPTNIDRTVARARAEGAAAERAKWVAVIGGMRRPVLEYSDFPDTVDSDDKVAGMWHSKGYDAALDDLRDQLTRGDA